MSAKWAKAMDGFSHVQLERYAELCSLERHHVLEGRERILSSACDGPRVGRIDELLGEPSLADGVGYPLTKGDIRRGFDSQACRESVGEVCHASRRTLSGPRRGAGHMDGRKACQDN